MVDNTHFLHHALRIVAQRRQQAITASIEAHEQARRQLPELAALQNERLRYGIQATRLAALGAKREQIDNALEQARRADLQSTQLLQNAGLQATSKPLFFCSLCQDRGRTPNGRFCQCVRKLVSSLRRKEVNRSSPLELSRFESFSLEKYPADFSAELGCTIREHMQRLLEYAMQWAQEFSLTNPSLYLCGNAGLGKTHLALAMAQTVLDEGYHVIYTSAQNIFDTLERERFQREGDTINTLLDADLVILDDLGTEYISPYVSSCLYSLVNTRVCRRLPTIYTTNLVNDQDLQRRYTEKIVSRLLGSCEMLYFCGNDLRLASKHSE